MPHLKNQAVTNTIYLAFKKKTTTFTSITRNEARARKKTTSRDPQPPETTENGANLLCNERIALWDLHIELWAIRWQTKSK